MIRVLDWSLPDDAFSFHTEAILKKFEWPIEYKRAEDGANIQDISNSQFDLHRWPFGRSHELLSLYPARPERVQLLECADGLVKKNGKIWPDLILPIAVKSAIRRRIRTLDLRLVAYVVAKDILVRPLVSAAVSLGFSQICLVSDDDQFLKSEKDFLNRRLIGVNIDTVLTNDLTLRPQNGGLLFNAINLNHKKDSLQDIAYFNFMSSDSIFMDLFEGDPHAYLQEEAHRAHLLGIRPVEIEWAWWSEAGQRLESPLSVSEAKSKEFLHNLDQGLIT